MPPASNPPPALRPLPSQDLHHILTHTLPLWQALRGEQLFLTGGTGFFGLWLVESFLHANAALSLGARLTVLTRSPSRFRARAPHLCHQAELTLHPGDIRDFPYPPGRYRYLIHAATDSVVPSGTPAADELAAIVQGTAHTLAFARQAGATRLLLTSSGAVYGPQPLTLSHLPEEHPFAPSQQPYTLGKRQAEQLCMEASTASQAASQSPVSEPDASQSPASRPFQNEPPPAPSLAPNPDPGLACILARGFAFLGPHLPLDAHFAAGNFLRDALAGVPLSIAGDGTPRRSYLYAADLAIWLWTLLLRGTPGRAYNVGSEHAVSIAELAHRTAALLHPGLPIHIAQPAPPPNAHPLRYVPSTARARSELGLTTLIPLDEAILRTAAYHSAYHGQSSRQQ